jgi:hypothetical protein
MPDADDFDVEYFRSLLSGGSGKPHPEAPAPSLKSSAVKAAKKPAAKAVKKPKPRRKP